VAVLELFPVVKITTSHTNDAVEFNGRTMKGHPMSLKDEIQAAQDSLAQAFIARDAVRGASLCTRDARLMPDGVPTCVGQEAVCDFFGQAIEQGIVSARFTTQDVEGDDTQAVEIGRYELFASHPSDDRIRVEDGRYLVVWRKEGGSWRIYRGMFNRRQAATQ
jgi:ketosteroid isomerase-like protein